MRRLWVILAVRDEGPVVFVHVVLVFEEAAPQQKIDHQTRKQQTATPEERVDVVQRQRENSHYEPVYAQ